MAAEMQGGKRSLTDRVLVIQFSLCQQPGRCFSMTEMRMRNVLSTIAIEAESVVEFRLRPA